MLAGFFEFSPTIQFFILKNAILDFIYYLCFTKESCAYTHTYIYVHIQILLTMSLDIVEKNCINCLFLAIVLV